MLKFIEGDALADELKRFMESSTSAQLAVAFWGKGSISRFDLSRGRNVKVICNLESGACHPDEINEMRSLVDIRKHPKIHAKLYLTDKAVIVGSSNASTNGLAIPSSNATAWYEANILTDEKEMLLSAGRWFKRRWKEATEISEIDIRRAREAWKKRSQSTILDRKASSLIEALRADPELLDSANIYCLAWRDPLDKEAKALTKEKRRTNHSLRDAHFYQPVKPFISGSWLIRCDFDDEREPSIEGYYLVPYPRISFRVDGKQPAYAAFQTRAIKIGNQFYCLSAQEKKELIEKLKLRCDLKRVWQNGDALIPLRELIC